jgi:geranyl diphosphate synthase
VPREEVTYDDAGPINPFKIVDEELRAIGERMRRAVTSDIPALSTASEYFFKLGAEGKRVRPTVLMLMASAMTNGVMTSAAQGGWRETDHAPAHQAPADVRRRQQRLAEIAEMIHVASLLHDDVLDNAATRRGLRALNLEVGNKLAILAGDFLLARASVTLASLRNTEVIELLSRVLEHLVAGEVMQMTAKPESLSSMDHYVKKTYYKTASLIANSSKAIALLGGHGEESAQLAYDYGKNLGLAFQFQDDVLDFIGSESLLGKPTLGDLKEGIATAPVLFAVQEFPELSDLVERRFKHSGDVQRAHELVKSSQGIARTQELAREHCDLAIAAIDRLPASESKYAMHCRRALKELAKRAVERSK